MKSINEPDQVFTPTKSQCPVQSPISRQSGASFAFLLPLISSLAFFPPALNSFQESRFLVVGVSLLLMHLIALKKSATPIPTSRYSKIQPVLSILAILFLVVLLSLFNAHAKSEGFVVVARHFLLMDLTWLWYLWFNENRTSFSRWTTAVTLVTGIVNGLSILEINGLLMPVGDLTPVLLMGNRNFLASYDVLTFFLILPSLRQGNVFRRVLTSTTLLSSVMMIVAIKSRAAWISILGGLVFCGALVLIRHLRSKMSWKCSGTHVTISLLIVAVIGLTILVNPLRKDGADRTDKRVISIVDPSDRSNAIRLALWRKTLSLIHGHLSLGVGAGNWKTSITSLGIGDIPDANYRLIPIQAHNDYLQTAAETGIVGGMLLVAAILTALWAATRNFWQSAGSDGYRYLACAGGLLAFAIVAAFSFPMERIEHLVLLSGCFAGAIHRSLPKRERAVFEEKSETLIPDVAGVLLAVGICILAVYRSLVEIQVKKMYTLFEAGKFTEIHSSHLAKVGIFYELDPEGTPVNYVLGSALLQSGRQREAEISLLNALAVHPWYPMTLNALGALSYRKGQLSKALAYCHQAIQIAPDYKDAGVNEIVFLFESGRVADAQEALKCLKNHLPAENFTLLEKALK